MLDLLSRIAYVAMVASLVGLILLRGLFSDSVPVILVQLASAGLMLWARITFGRRSFHLAANPTAGGLVVSGPYRYIRHPIYTSVCLFVAAGVASHLSWKTCLLGGLVLAGALARMLSEERLLQAQYPAYGEYRKKTWRMVPCVF